MCIRDRKKTCGRKYFYYRCNSVGHHGKTACSTRQIGTDRLHDMVYRNLFRISLDTEYLKNLVFSLQNQTRPGPKEGFEPTQDCYKITPENLQKSLTAYVKAVSYPHRVSARLPGADSSFWVPQDVFLSSDVRKDSPRISILKAWWKSLSQRASAMVGSPMAACQFLAGS